MIGRGKERDKERDQDKEKEDKRREIGIERNIVKGKEED